MLREIGYMVAKGQLGVKAEAKIPPSRFGVNDDVGCKLKGSERVLFLHEASLLPEVGTRKSCEITSASTPILQCMLPTDGVGAGLCRQYPPVTWKCGLEGSGCTQEGDSDSVDGIGVLDSVCVPRVLDIGRFGVVSSRETRAPRAHGIDNGA